MTGSDRHAPSHRQLSVRFLLLMVLWALLLFVPAGTLRWIQAWALLCACTAYFIIYALCVLRRDPEQLRERSTTASNTEPWDRVILRVYSVLLVLLFVVAGLDAVRFRWAHAGTAAQIAAWLGLVVAGALILWTARSNTFLSRVARIQADRGQVVITSGPYAYVRHPMYAGIILLFVCVGPALASIWALLPGVLIGLLFVVRTALEDRMLLGELAGYREYSQRVRWRLLPGVW